MCARVGQDGCPERIKGSGSYSYHDIPLCLANGEVGIAEGDFAKVGR